MTSKKHTNYTHSYNYYYDYDYHKMLGAVLQARVLNSGRFSTTIPKI